MSNKKILALALIFGLLTAFFVNLYLQKVKTSFNTVVMGQVVAAKGPVSARTEVTAEMLDLKSIPKDLIHPKAVTNPKDAIGKITLVDLVEGEQILNSRLVGRADSGKGLAYTVPKGMRAISVGVNQVTGLSNLIQPKDWVDVVGLMDLDAPGQTQTTAGGSQTKQIPVAKIILQDVQVLAVNQRLEEKQAAVSESKEAPTESKTVTLAVKPEDAEKLVLVTERGTIRLILRSPVDKAKGVPKPYSSKEFLTR